MDRQKQKVELGGQGSVFIKKKIVVNMTCVPSEKVSVYTMKPRQRLSNYHTVDRKGGGGWGP